MQRALAVNDPTRSDNNTQYQNKNYQQHFFHDYRLLSKPWPPGLPTSQ
jgi:hypothetical protein